MIFFQIFKTFRDIFLKMEIIFLKFAVSRYFFKSLPFRDIQGIFCLLSS